MDAVHGEARDVVGQEDRPVDLPTPHEGGGGVHDAAVDEDGGQGPEDAERQAAAAQKALAEEDTRQKANDAHGEHLPGRQRCLPEEDIGDQHRHRAH